MGLDMWVRRVKKVDLEDRCYTSGELSSYSVLPVSDFEKSPGMFDQLLPYVTKVSVENGYYDVDKIIEDYHLPLNSHIGRISRDGIVVSGKDVRTNKLKRAEISRADIDEKYTKIICEPSYVFEAEEVAYWRKHYALQSAFYDAIEDVENCGYYVLNRATIENLRDEFPDDMEDVPGEDPTEESALFYHEWY